MWKFIRFELQYWLKTPMVWIFLCINLLLTFFATASDKIVIGGSFGNIFKNAPFAIENFYSVLSILCLLMTTAFMNTAANRDFQYNMYQFIFASPIRKRDYFFGKFIGAAIISLIPLVGISIGTLLAPLLSPIFDMAPAERFGPVIWGGHIQGMLAFGIPNVFISGVLLFSLAVIFRNNIVSFIGAMLLIVLYTFSGSYMKDIQNEWLAGMIDPFGGNSFEVMTKYLTVDEKNYQAVALAGPLLMNRLIWIGITFAILMIIYFRFSFNAKREKPKKRKKSKTVAVPAVTPVVYTPAKANVFSFKILFNLIKFETRAIVKNPSFITIMAIGLIILIVNMSSVTGYFGTMRYPVTYIIVDQIIDAYGPFMLGFIAFYSGVLVWKERDAKLNEIQDATPIQTVVLFVSKLSAMMVSIALVLSCTIIIGMLTQTAYGYTRYEPLVYIKSLLVLRLSSYLFLTVLSLLFHYLINNRYLAYFAFIAFIIVSQFIWKLFEVDTNMINFGHRPDIIFSDMNGFGPFVTGTVWFSLYWFFFCVILCLIIVLFYIRGKEEQFRYRWTNAKKAFGNRKIMIGLSLGLFALCGGFVYYNTQILNHYDSSEQMQKDQIAYETKYKKYENLVQPRFYKFDYHIDIRPEDRSLKTHVTAWAKNISSESISELHFTLPQLSDSIQIDIPGGKIKTNDKKLFYRIYGLSKPLAPNDSIKLNIRLWKFNNGFENEVSFHELTENGTFFNNTDIMPIFGYNKDYEISDKNKRAKLKLPKRERMPKLDDNNLAARSNTYIGNDSDWVNVTTTISTSPDQTAIAPGSLVKKWTQDGRNYFTYKLDHQALNFYSFISARYEIARKKWNGVDLEVYYDKAHAYNVPNMLNAMQKSLQYYTAHFGPYFHKQCRIIEFPRYAQFAQAFPGTMPYSEGIGFITDLRSVTKDDIDMVFYVVAHEMGHQYWAHQICGANMQGSEMMSEGFAQYSALMVMEKEYGKDKMKKFLEYEMNDYLSGRSDELEAERPLMKTENQQYIHYNKASVVMYYLKEMIGEKNVNAALANLIREFGYKNPPYATSNNAVREFKRVTPDSLQYLISDMFENITLFNNRMIEAKYKKVGDGYEIEMKTLSEKFRSDSLGKETKIPIADYIDIAVFSKPEGKAETGKVLVKKRVKIIKSENVFSFKTIELPYQAGIDPYNYLIDRVPDDNIKKISE